MSVLSHRVQRYRRRLAEPAPAEVRAMVPVTGRSLQGPELELRPPGVVFQWAPSADRLTLDGLRDAAGFVGLAARGPLFQALEISDMTQFLSVYGSYEPWAYLAYAASAFFENGGRRLWVVRVADAGAAAAAACELADAATGRRVRLEATSPGTWGDGVFVDAAPLTGRRFDLTVALPSGDVYESFPGLTLEPGVPGNLVATLDREAGGSQLVRASYVDGPEAGQPLEVPPGGQVRLSGGAGGIDSLTPEDFSAGLAVLAKIPAVGLLAMPDIMPKTDLPLPPVSPPVRCGTLSPRASVPRTPGRAGKPRPPELSPETIHRLQQEMVGQAERLRDRVALLDPLPGQAGTADLRGWRGRFDSSYAAAYAPWIEMPDPLRGRGEQSVDRLVREVPPSGHAAGVVARVLATRGPAKPPANEVVLAARAATGSVSPAAWALLNEEGLNLIRAFPSRGLRIMGARTLASGRDFRYLNVRLLMIFIEQQLEVLLQPAVFEPNTPATWEMVERLVSSFLAEIWQRGWLDGATPAEAFSVQCDATTTPDDIEAGRMICLVSVLAPWPAEFITIRLGIADGSLTIFSVVAGDQGEVI